MFLELLPFTNGQFCPVAKNWFELRELPDIATPCERFLTQVQGEFSLKSPGTH